jgi:glyoxylase-like metal-dependent hydrolase (beta-lactamase superfamily II)
MADYSIWVLEFAAVEKFPVSVMMYNTQGQGTRKLPYGYVLIQGPGGTALVDAGYDHKGYGKELADLYGVSNWRAPGEVLAECGVTPEDVTAIFVTHAHFDHLGGMDYFPNATVYIQERELSQWVWALGLGPEFAFLQAATDPADIMKCVDMAKNGRVVVVNGDVEDAIPGVDLHLAADTHTYGSMYVRIRNDGASPSRDSWIVAGDLLYTYDNLTGLDPEHPQIVPIGLATGSQHNLIFSTTRMLEAVGGDPRRLIPVHEDRLKDMFPSRRTAAGHRVIEIALADGAVSQVA